MVIAQGDVYWVELGRPRGSEPGYRHPMIVIQNDAYNRSAIATVIVCALTSNLKRAASPGNVRLAKGEANLPKPSVANVTQVATVDKSQLVQRIGKLSKSKTRLILEGVAGVLVPT